MEEEEVREEENEKMEERDSGGEGKLQDNGCAFLVPLGYEASC